MRELYERYKGRIAHSFGITGKICGYNNNSLIMGVLDGIGWELLPEDYSKFFIHMDVNIVGTNSFNGFYCIEERHIDKCFKFGR